MRVRSARIQKAMSMSMATSRSDTDEPTTGFVPVAVHDLDASGEPPIRVCGLVKHLGCFRALDSPDLTVETGSVHDFLGPSGAGRFTTIRVLLGLYRPDGRSVDMLTRGPWRQAALVNQQVSYVSGDVALWPALTGGRILDTLAGLRGSRDAEREAEFIERFDLDSSKRIRTYSEGNRQKVAPVAALATPTNLLTFDGLTSGLNSLVGRIFTKEAVRAAAEGHTVLLPSHILAEVQHLYSTVTIIKDDRIVEQGNLGTLQRLSHTRIGLGAVDTELSTIRQAVEALGLDVVKDDGCLNLGVAAEQVPVVLNLAGEHRIQDITCGPTSPEDLSLRHYEEA